MEQPKADWHSFFIYENFYGFLGQFVTMLAGLAVTILFPKLLGAYEFGLFAAAFAIANFCVYFADFGIASAVTRFAAAHKRDAGAYFFHYLPHKIILGVIISGLVFFLAPLLATHVFYSPAIVDGIRASAFFVLGYTLFFYIESFMAGIFKNKYSFVANFAYSGLRVVVPIVLFYLIFKSYVSFLAGVSIATFIAAGVAAVGLLLLGIKRDGYVNTDAFGYYLKYTAIGGLGTIMIFWIDSLVLAAFISPQELGFYRLAASWVAAIALLIPFSSRVLNASFAESYIERDHEKTSRLFFSSVRYTLAFVFLLILGIALLADKFVVFIYGDAFASTSGFFRIFSFLILETGLNAITLTYMLGRGRARLYAFLILALGISQLLISLLFSLAGIGPWWVAVAITLVRLAVSLWLLAYVTIAVDATGWKVFFRAPLLALAMFVVFSLLFSPLVHTKIEALVYVVFITATYSALIFATGALEWRSFVAIVRKTMRIGGH